MEGFFPFIIFSLANQLALVGEEAVDKLSEAQISCSHAVRIWALPEILRAFIEDKRASDIFRKLNS